MAHELNGKRCEGTGAVAAQAFEAAPYKPVRIEPDPEPAPPKRAPLPPLPTPRPITPMRRTGLYDGFFYGTEYAPWAKEGKTQSQWAAEKRKEYAERNAGSGYGDGSSGRDRAISAGLPGLGKRR